MCESNTEHATGPADGASGVGVPKVCGGDVELGNIIVGLTGPNSTCSQASRALLHEINGIGRDGPGHGRSAPVDGHGSAEPGAVVRATPPSSGCFAGPTQYNYGDNYGYNYGGGSSYNSQWGSTYNPQDYGRKYLASNGGCIYIDLNHLELCLPEVRSAHDHVAAWHAMLLIARDAMCAANAKLPEGRRIMVLVNNTDDHGHSYGGHMNFLVSRRCWDNIFHYKPHYMSYLTSYLTSSILFTGAGKVGSANGRPAVDFQIAQRADFYETLTGLQTTHRRPIVNSRDEPLCEGPAGVDGRLGPGLARMHVIFFDSTLCHVASLLKVGATQIVLAMIEQEQIDPSLMLDDPLKALLRWSHDPSLDSKAKRVWGGRCTAAEMQQAILEGAQRFVSRGRADGIVPQAREIVGIWQETIDLFEKRDFAALAGKIDWVLKKALLDRAISRRGLRWDAPEIRHLDHLYCSLDPDEGLYWACQRDGVVQRVVTASEIERFVHEPPDDTRAWLRAKILRSMPPESISSVDWDGIRFRFRRDGASAWQSYDYCQLPMDDPLGFTRSQCERVFAGAVSLRHALETLGMHSTSRPVQPVGAPPTGGTQIVPVNQLPLEPFADTEDGYWQDNMTDPM